MKPTTTRTTKLNEAMKIKFAAASARIEANKKRLESLRSERTL